MITIALFDFVNREKLKTSFYKDLSSCRYQTMNAIFFMNFLMEVYIFYHASISYFDDVNGDFQEMYLWVFHSCGLLIVVYILYFLNLIKMGF